MKALILIPILFLLIIALLVINGKYNENYCAVAPRFDYFYQVNSSSPVCEKNPFPTGYVSGMAGMPNCDPMTCNKGIAVVQGDELRKVRELTQEQISDPRILGRDYVGRVLFGDEPVTTNEGFQCDSEKSLTNWNLKECDMCPKSSQESTKCGTVANSDTVGSPFDEGCRSCGTDYISAAPKRDRYFQPAMGYMGDNIMSGYPYYKAI